MSNSDLDDLLREAVNRIKSLEKRVEDLEQQETPVVDLTGLLSGSGVLDRLALWTGAGSLGSDANFTVNSGSLIVGQQVRAGAGLRPDNDINRQHRSRTIILADDATTQASLVSVRPYAFFWIRDTTDGHSAILHTRGGVDTAHVVWEVSAGSWAVADTDTKHCLFVTGGAYVFKNRRGASRTYHLHEFTLA